MAATIHPDYHALQPVLDAIRADGQSVALTNGCFDVLHVGHARLIAQARELADVLVVALNGDSSVRRTKGKGRPFVPLVERMELVAALGGVTYVTSFDESTAHTLLETLRPDVHVKGTDWTAETVPERDTVLAYGGRIVIAGDKKSHASSVLIDKLRS